MQIADVAPGRGSRVGHFTGVVSAFALLFDGQSAMLRHVNRATTRSRRPDHHSATASHDKESPMAKEEETKKQGEETTEEKDVEGHNIFATHDYYVQRNIDRRSEIDRDVRERQRAKEAEDKKKNSR
jgi:hypothetical protein